MRIETHRYFLKSLQELMFNSLSTAFIIFGDVCREKYILDFEKFIFWLEREQKVKDGFYGAAIFFCSLWQKGWGCRWRKCAWKLATSQSFYPNPILEVNLLLDKVCRYSMQRMKMYDESGSPCLISLEGGKGWSLSLFTKTERFEVVIQAIIKSIHRGGGIVEAEHVLNEP